MNGKRPNPYNNNNNYGGYKRRNVEEEKHNPNRPQYQQMDPQNEKEYKTHKQAIGLMIIGLIRIDFDFTQLRQPLYEIPEQARPLLKAYGDSRKKILELNPNCTQHMDKSYFYGIQYFQGYVNHTVANKRVPQTQLVANASQLDNMVRELDNYFKTKEENEELLKDLLPFEEIFDKAVSAHNKFMSMSSDQVLDKCFKQVKEKEEKALERRAERVVEAAAQKLKEAEEERSAFAEALQESQEKDNQ